MTKQYENEVSSVAFECCRWSSQSIVVLHFYSQLVLPPYTVKIRGGRHSTTHGEGSSRWALVLPPNTVKIRGGRSIFLHHSQARVLPSYPIKTRRGHSTLCQAHVLPPHAVKTRGGRSTFYHGHGEVHLSTSHISEPLFVSYPGGTSVFRVHTILTLPNLPRCSMIAASSTKSRANSIQSMHIT